MKNTNKSSRRYRSSLKWGIKAVIVFSLLLAGTGCHSDKDTRTKVKQPTTTEVTSCLSTTISTSITSTISSTTTSTTTTTTTAQTTLMIQPVTESQTIAVVTEPVYVAPVTEYVEPVYNNGGYNESDAILMAQVINKEASASYDGKLAVASVIVNRSNYFGQSITDVVYAPNQFSVVGYLGSYTDADYQAAVQVLTNGSVNNAFYFDGGHADCLNHFRDINNNYIGAW